ncbi:precorrin-2 C20-methyltransferase/precorrin-3B C17-methyltransferase [Kineosphaera limosa]|uniref:Precorrin-2 C20-methyltransferase/precorrin-3B C17-methyltransferase n=1 Tax=Kineosphaera limosa NBRC 100340 TaxID=1184609 RepID=K6WWS3_9MICO|nr:precorrin-2 C(20)-methyltransferase [Kineosphaera limosa]NYD99087.1 precorrin-2 C20-methyltransferase/precorrin-3B C17-methyltransferase [Kineosphaera limosa]GAB96552.1 precorrin-2 C20-methyltransferase/precorrin-3B C17-methyltransferase [Kineosphaera limosa NBRC 100340]
MSTPGTLVGVGVGPGDPDLLTLAAAKAIAEADVVAFHSARHGRSVARGIVAKHLRPDHIEVHLVYPVTTETSEHPGGYAGAMADFYDEATERLAEHLAAGQTVALLAEGDPFVHSSHQHLHSRLAGRFPTRVIPGISSITAAGASLGRPLVEATETLAVLPGTLPEEELAARLGEADTAVVMKLGRTFGRVRDALVRAGRWEEAWYVERASTPDERVLPASEVDPEQVPYFSLLVVPSRVGDPASKRDPSPAATTADDSAAKETGTEETGAEETGTEGAPAEPTMGEVTVVGLGPAGPLWLTPEAKAALSAATDLVGYTTYVRRVPLRPGQVAHDSDNKVESERAEFALDLARRGHRVAVVSSGDPGVFAMASAVLEVACEPEYAHVPVRVLPGVTAAHAAASRVGAPLGHDYATISLSDRLKPFEVVRQRVRATAQADLAIALYNPASKERTWQVGVVRDDLLAIRDPQTPVIVARAVGAPDERVSVTTLGELDPGVVDMRTLLIIGSSQTLIAQRGADAADSVVYTPRRYPDLATDPSTDAQADAPTDTQADAPTDAQADAPIEQTAGAGPTQ